MKPVEFGDYTLVKKLATGGMGEVFLARQEQGAGFERYVAIKRILPELSGDDEFVRMFLDEARLAARLNHPNVVQIYDLGICGDQYYLAMEFLEGRDLRRIMGRLGTHDRALPGAHAVQIIYGAAEGLHYAHELRDAHGTPLNIIHRDVSPQNIFISFDGTIKVLDFGIAKAEARSVRTKTGGLKGKYPYLSPEQVKGEEVDGRSDVFSLGTVLWEVTIGRRLFKRDNDLLTLQAVLQCEVPPPSALMNNYPPELEAIVMKALARKPEDRYATCRAFQEDLEQFMGQFGLVLTPLKLGAFVKNLFNDEAQTVTDILDSLRKAPKSKSLLKHDGEGADLGDSFSLDSPSASSGHAEESTDSSASASSSSADSELLAGIVARAREEQSASHSSVPRPGADEKQPAPGLADIFAGLEAIGITPEAEPSATPSKAPLPIAPPRPKAAPPPPPPRQFGPDVAVMPTSILSLPTRREADGDEDEDDDSAHAIARAPTAVISVPGPGDAGWRTPPKGPALPQPAGEDDPDAVELSTSELEASPPPGPFASLSPTPSPVPPVEAAIEGPPRHDRLADLVALIKLWPKATLAAVAAAVVIPFAIVFAVIGANGAGAAGAATDPPRDAGLADAASPNASNVGPPTQAPEAAVAPSPEAGPAPSPEAGPGPAGGIALAADAAPGPDAGPRDAAIAPPPPLRPEPRDAGTKVVSNPPRPPTSPQEPPTTGPRGSLSLRIRPYADVWIDGRRVGLTPMPPVPLTPGRHRIRLVCDSLNRSVLRTVVIGPGERVTLTVDMNE